jgi:putative transposase
MTIEFKGSKRAILSEMSFFGACAGMWHIRISYGQIEDIMGERGVEVDHSTLHRWVLKYVPALEKAFLARKRPVGGSGRMDETHVKIKGTWRYLYRAVDK